MADVFRIKRHDREPSLRVTIKNADGTAFDLTGYSAPLFIMRSAGSATPKFTAPATIEDAAGGVIRYDWGVSDTDTDGSFDAEIEVTTPGAKKQTFPTGGYLKVKVVADLNNA